MQESPIVVGPYTRSATQCLQCCAIVSSKARYDCTRCGFPLCGAVCQAGKYHIQECRLFESVGYRATIEELGDFNQQYSAVTVLRLLMVMEKEDEKEVDDEKSDEDCEYTEGMIRTMMDHNKEREREQPDLWKFEKEFIINFIQKVTHKDINAEIIHSIVRSR